LKTVYLLRHAKSSWDDPLLGDIQRPLAPRGRKAAPRIGRYMASNLWIPDRVLCSAALRAVQTWDLVSFELDRPIRVEIREDLYSASPGDLLQAFQNLPDTVGSVLMVGHNPTLQNFALSLLADGRSEAVAELRQKYPTGGLALIEFSAGEWRDVATGAGYLQEFVLPRRLKAR